MRIKLLFLLCIFSWQYIVPTTYTVTTTADSGAGSLRQAILDANSNSSTPHTINFSISSGVQTITLLTALPSITRSNITIDGSTQPGWSAGDPQIVLDGSSLTAFTIDGLTIDNASNITIQDLVINNGFLSGIYIVGNCNNNTISNCFSGVAQTGTSASANQFGIYVLATVGNTNNNTIIDNNICSGNSGSGLGVGIIISGNINNITIQNNKIGTDKATTGSIPNTSVGLGLLTIPPGSTSVLINGGTIQNNTISGNSTAPGFFMGYQSITNLTIQNNFIGTDSTGTIAVPNALGLITFTELATTITNCTFQNNLISANPGGNFGLQLTINNNNIIRANKFGTNITGTSILGTNGNGISVQGNNNTIGGSTTSDGNLVAGTTGSGIQISYGSSGNTISNNYIGCDVNGVSGSATFAIGNNGIEISGYDYGSSTANNSDENIIENNLISRTSSSGIYLDKGCNSTTINNNIIGTDVDGTTARSIGNNGIQIEGNDFTNHVAVNSNDSIVTNNLVSNCTQTGIFINSGCNNSIVQGNKIGTDITGTVNMGNGNCGIQIQGNDNNTLVGSNNTQIGGTNSSERNIICGSTNQGININLGVSNTIIQGNYIGVDSTGLVAIPNNQQGISISGYNGSVSIPCNNTQIGGTTTSARNIIAGNGNCGIQLTNDVNDTIIQGNYIGVGSNGTTTIANTNVGIFVQGNSSAPSNGTIIGGTTSGAFNIIAASTSEGIFLNNNIHNSVIQGNFIGTDASATLNLGNGNNGILITGVGAEASTNNLIGGTSTTTKNIIKNNTGSGISINDDCILNPILGNEIYNNGGNGIVLSGNANNLQPAPTLGTAEYCVDNTVVVITVTAPTTPLSSNFRIELFGNTTDTNPKTEGQFFLGAITSLASGTSTTVSFSTTNIGIGNFISATATNLNNTGNTPGDTSEFTLNITITASTEPTAFLSADPTAICFGTYSDLTLTMTGTSPFSVLWSDGFQQSNVTSPLLRAVNPGSTTNYSALVVNALGCGSNSNTVNITVYPLANITMESSSPLIYPGQAVTITVNITGNGPFDVTWFDGVTQTGIISSTSRTFTLTQPTNISVNVVDANGCESSSSIFLFTGKMSLIVQAILRKYGSI